MFLEIGALLSGALRGTPQGRQREEQSILVIRYIKVTVFLLLLSADKNYCWHLLGSRHWSPHQSAGLGICLRHYFITKGFSSSVSIVFEQSVLWLWLEQISFGAHMCQRKQNFKKNYRNWLFCLKLSLVTPLFIGGHHSSRLGLWIQITHRRSVTVWERTSSQEPRASACADACGLLMSLTNVTIFLAHEVHSRKIPLLVGIISSCFFQYNEKIAERVLWTYRLLSWHESIASIIGYIYQNTFLNKARLTWKGVRSTTFRLVPVGGMLAEGEISGLLSVLLLPFRLPALGKRGWDWGNTEETGDKREITPRKTSAETACDGRPLVFLWLYSSVLVFHFLLFTELRLESWI